MNLPELRDSRLELDGRIATLTLDRHDVRNELTGTHLADEIATVCAWLNTHETASVLILTGAGSAFCAGGNVKQMRDRESGSFAGDVYTVQNRYRAGIQRMALAMAGLEIPAIAAVNGPAIGAGCDLATMCDIRLAAEGAKFAESFINLGIVPGDGGGWFMQRRIPYQRAAELTFSGRMIDAAEALAIGLVLEVLPAGELLARAREMAAGFAAKPPRAVRMTKRLLTYARRMDLPDYLDLCALMQGMAHNAEDHEEAVAAFLEKRTPAFRGR